MTEANVRPYERLAKHLATMGRGPGRSRPLSEAEAEDAFTLLLRGEADPLQVGAFLLLMRYRGETAPELAGMTRAARRFGGFAGEEPHRRPALDWPSYAAGRSRGAPWFLLAALLVAHAGHPVLMHGANGHSDRDADTEAAVRLLGLPICRSPAEATHALASGGFAYLPLRHLSPSLASLAGLKPLLGLRTPVNSLLRLLNPLGAPASLIGVFHPAYRDLHRDAVRILGGQDLSVIKGGAGEAERNPLKPIELQRLLAGEPRDVLLPPLLEQGRGERPAIAALDRWQAVWQGRIDDPVAEATVTGTAALALMTVRGMISATDHSACLAEAADIWQRRGSLRS